MSAGGEPKEILLVDDDLDYCELTRARLEAAGFRVAIASNGDEAMTFLDQGHRPDLMILDIEMPDKNGLTTLIQLNVRAAAKPAGKGSPRIPVMIATGLEGKKIRRIMTANEIEDYLQKPFTAEELIHKVNRLLAPAAERSS